MSAPATFDHVVLATSDLAAGITEVEERTGVRAVRGGAHPTGTANALIALTRDGARGPAYLEIIGPDLDRAPGVEPAAFGIGQRRGLAVAGFAVHPDDITAAAAAARAAGEDPGPVGPLSRRTPAGVLLEWRLAKDGQGMPVLPFLIDWGRTPQPGLGDLPTLELRALRAESSRPAHHRAVLRATGTDLDLVPASEDALELVLGSARGIHVFRSDEQKR